MLDLKIINGMVIDGTRSRRARADVAVRDGRIVAVGKVTERARETIDAAGRIVSPGFIDVHTHYDAQAFWDPKLSPSCYHGVTTVFGGFCGFSIAPMTPDAATYIAPMLARVEGMPLHTLETAVPWGTWSSFGEFLQKLTGRIGLNTGFYCGHSAIRRIAMGGRAVGNKATWDEVQRMKQLLSRSLEEGALGFSTTISPTHNDANGDPVPSRWADYSEIIELGRVVKDHAGTGLELLPDLDFGPGISEVMANLSVAGNRPVNWNALAVMDMPNMLDIVKFQLGVSDYARKMGGEVIALAHVSTPELFLNFRSGAGWDVNPGIWRELFKFDLSERKEKFRDPAIRKRMAEDAATMSPNSPLFFFTQFGDYLVSSVAAAENKRYVGQRVSDIAEKEGRNALDVMLDIALADDLTTTFLTQKGGEDKKAYELRGKIWRDDRTLVGASDSGAHLDMIDSFAFSTTLLEKGVREYNVIALEEAVYQITDRHARYYGLIDRGRLSPGYHADIVVFDEATVGRGPIHLRFDVPGNEGRMYADAVGIDHVLVNGVEIVRNQEHTGRLPGTVLRSGRDTRTVLPGQMREDRPSELAR